MPIPLERCSVLSRRRRNDRRCEHERARETRNPVVTVFRAVDSPIHFRAYARPADRAHQLCISLGVNGTRPAPGNSIAENRRLLRMIRVDLRSDLSPTCRQYSARSARTRNRRKILAATVSHRARTARNHFAAAHPVKIMIIIFPRGQKILPR